MDEENNLKKTSTKKKATKKATSANSTAKKSSATKVGTKSTTNRKSATKTATTKKNLSAKTTSKVSPKKTATKTVKKVEKKDKEKDLAPIIKESTIEEKSAKILEETVIEEHQEKEEQVTKLEEKTPIDVTRRTVKKIIPLSNYLIAAIIIVWIVIIAYVGYEFSRRHQENLYQEGYFIHEKIDIKKISLSEAGNVAHDAKDPTFILFNYRGYEETYELEKELWKIMNDYHINNNFYYVDLTDENGTLNCDMNCVLNTGLNVTKFKNVPAVAYYERGTLIDIAQREDKKVLEAADFVKLLDMYEFKR